MIQSNFLHKIQTSFVVGRVSSPSSRDRFIFISLTLLFYLLVPDLLETESSSSYLSLSRGLKCQFQFLKKWRFDNRAHTLCVMQKLSSSHRCRSQMLIESLILLAEKKKRLQSVLSSRLIKWNINSSPLRRRWLEMKMRILELKVNEIKKLSSVVTSYFSGLRFYAIFFLCIWGGANFQQNFENFSAIVI